MDLKGKLYAHGQSLKPGKPEAPEFPRTFLAHCSYLLHLHYPSPANPVHTAWQPSFLLLPLGHQSLQPPAFKRARRGEGTRLLQHTQDDSVNYPGP